MSAHAENRRLSLVCLLTAGMTLFLIGVGGMVTSKGAGMAVPDWPNTYGYNMFLFPPSKWVGGIFYEHTHRLVASAVGFLTIILAAGLFGWRSRPVLRGLGIILVVLGGLMAFLATDHLSWAVMMMLTGLAGWVAGRVWPRNEPASRTLRALGLIALAGVILQGVLGGLRVTLLQDAIGIVHAALAQMFFALIAVICLLNSGGWRRLNAAGDFTVPTRAYAWLVGLTTGLVFAQLMIGAGMRHQHAGLAVPDFPMAYGKFWPATDEASVQSYNRQRIEVVWANPITAGQVRLHMVHRLVAFGILAAVVLVAARGWRYGRGHPVRRWGVLWVGLILGQGILGAATVWSNKAADVATGHVVVGALCLVTGVLFTLVCFQLRGQERIVRISSVTAAGPSDNFPPVSSAVPEAR